MKIHHAFAILLLTGLPACSQTNRIVKQGFAYQSVRNAGTIAVDDNGNQISKATDTVFIVYLETKSKEVSWEHAEYKTTDYSIAATVADERPVVIGIDKDTGERLLFHPAPGNTVWKLELISGKPGTNASANGSVVIKGKIGDTVFQYSVKKLADVLQPDSY